MVAAVVVFALLWVSFARLAACAQRLRVHGDGLCFQEVEAEAAAAAPRARASCLTACRLLCSAKLWPLAFTTLLHQVR